MIPHKFPQSTHSLGAPKYWDEQKHGECSMLPVYLNEDTVISCWKPTLMERVRFLFGANLWCYVWSGKTQPPIGFHVCKDIFKVKG